MIDFGRGEERLNKFHGSEVKTTISFENTIYMLKYPDPVRDAKNTLSYMNNQFSEHIGCRIFKACGFDAQETLMGYYADPKGTRKIVVACKDFTQDGSTLYEFSKLSNQTQVEGKTGTTIESVFQVISLNRLVTDKKVIWEKFWDMFVIDALIGNPDRHFDNWGLLEKDGQIRFAPIYDCGSALAALIDDKKMEKIISNPSAFKSEEYNLTSCYYLSAKRIFYHEIFKNPPEALSAAIRRIVPNIDMAIIWKIVDDTPEMPDIRKQYLKKALALRQRDILLPALQREIAIDHKPSLEDTLRINAQRSKLQNHPPPQQKTIHDLEL